MANKSYKALFFNTSLSCGSANYRFRDIFDPLQPHFLANSINLPIRNILGIDYQVRDLAQYGQGSVLHGVFGRLRDDAPNKVDHGGAETQLPLLPTDRLVEKCYFLYYQNTDILVWQSNRDVGSANRFAEYMSDLVSQIWQSTYIFNVNPLLDQNSIQRVLAGDIKTIECKMARPNSPVNTQPIWNQRAFDLMNQVGGATVKINVSAARGILSNVSSLVQALVSDNTVQSLKVKLDGDEEPIDLFADRIGERFDVSLHGHYPLQADVLNKLDAAYTNQKAFIQNYFNTAAIQQFP